MPTVCDKTNFLKIAEGCGYPNLYSVDNLNDLQKVLKEVKYKDELCFVEIKASLGARDDLGRPTTTAKQNKENFMEYLKELK
jgi:phosphonopyruvate decarboxylase